MTMFWWPPRDGGKNPVAYDDTTGAVVSFQEILRSVRFLSGDSATLYHDDGKYRDTIILPRKAKKETLEALKRALPELKAEADRKEAAAEQKRKESLCIEEERAERLSKLPWMEVLRELLAMPQGELAELLLGAEEKKWSHYERKTSYGTRSDPSCGEWRRRILSIPIGAHRCITVNWDWEVTASWYGRD